MGDGILYILFWKLSWLFYKSVEALTCLGHCKLGRQKTLNITDRTLKLELLIFVSQNVLLG
jgi:hypothetical protein